MQWSASGRKPKSGNKTGLVDGMLIRKKGAAGHCDTCAEEKALRVPVNKASGTRAKKKKLDIVHTDVLGPIHQGQNNTRVSDMQSGSLTATLDIHETRSLRSWNSSFRMWPHREPLSQTGHKSTKQGVSTRSVARMAFSNSTQRLTLHKRMAKSCACGALSHQ